VAKVERLEEAVGRLLRAQGWTLAVAESCTGGLLAHTLTNVPGSSEYFDRCFVVYSNQAKTDLLGVPEELLQHAGAVSADVARAMAEGARLQAGTAVALASTGIAGPNGGTPEKPVGLVYVALAHAGGETLCEKHHFSGDRADIKEQTCWAALDLLRRFLVKEKGS
jgi:nicotinamide-nucleotide amidase